MTEPILLDLMRLQELLRATLDRAARGAGLGTSEYVVLRALAQTPGLSGAELARVVKVTPQSMHGVLVRLQRDGSIEPGPHPTDKRLRVFSLTRAGWAAARAATTGAAEIEARLGGSHRRGASAPLRIGARLRRGARGGGASSRGPRPPIVRL